MFGLFSSDTRSEREAEEKRNREIRERIRDLERELEAIEGKLRGAEYSYKDCLREIEKEKRTKDPDWRCAVEMYESQRTHIMSEIRYLKQKKEKVEREIDDLNRELGGGSWW